MNSGGGRRGTSGKLRLKRYVTDPVAGLETLVSANLDSAHSTGLKITSACLHFLYNCTL